MTPPKPSPSPETTVRFSRRMMVGLAVLLCAPWAVVGLLALRSDAVPLPPRRATVRTDGPRAGAGPAASSAPAGLTRDSTGPAAVATTSSATTMAGTVTSSDVTLSKAGPWGRMQLVPIVLELPDEYVLPAQATQLHDTWTFSDMTRDQAIAFMETCGLTTAELDLARASTWTPFGASCIFQPSDALLLSLSPDARAKLYAKLMADPANASVIDPYWYRPGRVEFRLRSSGLSDESMALLNRLLYPGPNGLLLLADVKPAMRAIADTAEQRRFAKAVTRKRSTMARLIIDADSDVAALAEYWGSDGRQKDIAPVLDALKFNVTSGVERPGKLNIVPLLPPFARERLYNHSSNVTSTNAPKQDCFWTAFNFFSDVPDDRINDMDYAAQVLQRDYYKVSEPSRLGDLILIADGTGKAIHAANYIADEIVFTKNGLASTQPWILVTMDDLLDTYRLKAAKIDVVYFRKR